MTNAYDDELNRHNRIGRLFASVPRPRNHLQTHQARAEEAMSAQKSTTHGDITKAAYQTLIDYTFSTQKGMRLRLGDNLPQYEAIPEGHQLAHIALELCKGTTNKALGGFSYVSESALARDLLKACAGKDEIYANDPLKLNQALDKSIQPLVLQKKREDIARREGR